MRRDNIEITRSLTLGNVFVLNEVAKRLKIDEILGKDRQGTLALWQSIAFLIASGSHWTSTTSPALDLAERHAIHGILGLSHIAEAEIKDNLDWLLSKQIDLEKIFGKLKNKSVWVDYDHAGYEAVKVLSAAIMQYLKTAWRCIARTVREELSSLAMVTVSEISVGGITRVMVSIPHQSTQDRLNTLGIHLPKSISIQSCKIIRKEKKR